MPIDRIGDETTLDQNIDDLQITVQDVGPEVGIPLEAPVFNKTFIIKDQDHMVFLAFLVERDDRDGINPNEGVIRLGARCQVLFGPSGIQTARRSELHRVCEILHYLLPIQGKKGLAGRNGTNGRFHRT